MAIFDLSQALDRAQFKERCNYLYRKASRVELTEKKGLRTIQQNSYLHLILSYFALQYGERMEYVKQELFKRRVNHGYFVLEHQDKIYGKVLVLRSSKTLTTKEMTECIERFRDWAVQEAGIYLPAPNEQTLIGEMEREVEDNKRWL